MCHHGRQDSHWRRKKQNPWVKSDRREKYIKKEKFLAAEPDLRCHLFKAKHNQSEQVANFTSFANIAKAQDGIECEPFGLESLSREEKSDPDELVPVTTEGGSMTKTEKIKFKSKCNKYPNRVQKVKLQLKQTYSNYYWQIDEETRGSLTKNP